MGIRQEVKSGKLSVNDALSGFVLLRKGGTHVGADIVRWLERRRGVVVAEKPQTKPRKNKRKRKEASA
jgi:hypothetical protein